MLGCIALYIYFTLVKLRNTVYAFFLNLFRLISVILAYIHSLHWCTVGVPL
jgi:hypothetical protein